MKFRKKPVVVEAFQWTGDIYQKDDPLSPGQLDRVLGILSSTIKDLSV